MTTQAAVTIKARVIPGPDNGAFDACPDRKGSAFGWWRVPVAADAPLGGGHEATGWYAVEEVSFPSWKDACRVVGGAVWDDRWGTDDAPDALAEGHAILRRLGYPVGDAI